MRLAKWKTKKKKIIKIIKIKTTLYNNKVF